MAIDPMSEEVLSLSQAAKRLPRLRNERPVAPSTLWRWASVGLRGVKLETVKVGGTTCTSMQALGRFLGLRSTIFPHLSLPHGATTRLRRR